MPSTESIAITAETFADFLKQLGDIPLDRIRMRPLPGTATEKDVLTALEAPNKRLYELVDGALVEKVMGTREGLLSGLILADLVSYLRKHKLGKALPGDAALQLMPGLIRYPDV